VSSKGHSTSNVSEAVWNWMQQGGIWYALKRISPWNLEDTENNNWDNAIMAAMDISSSSPFIQSIEF
jgi:hypothetical protein